MWSETDRNRNVEIAIAKNSGRTLDDVGREFGLSRERVRQIAKRANRTAKYYNEHLGLDFDESMRKMKADGKTLDPNEREPR